MGRLLSSRTGFGCLFFAAFAGTPERARVVPLPNRRRAASACFLFFHIGDPLLCGVDSSVAALCGRYVTVIDDGRCGFDDVVSEALSLVRSWPGSHAVGRAVRQESSLHPL